MKNQVIVMSASTVFLFETLIDKSQHAEAISVIRVLPNTVPTPAVLNKIIFNILMENCEGSLVNEISVYFKNVQGAMHKLMDPNYCYRAIFEDKNDCFDNPFVVFAFLINSSFNHHGIECEDIEWERQYVKYPNCDFLVHFYVHIFIKCISLNDNLFKDDNFDTRCNRFYSWLNKFYKHGKSRVPIVLDLHKLLDSLVSDRLKSSGHLSDDVVYNKKQMDILCNTLLNVCPDMCLKFANFKQFLKNCRHDNLKASICRTVLYHLNPSEKSSLDRPTFTLRTLVSDFLFCSSKTGGGSNTQKVKKNVHEKKINPQELLKQTEGNTDLHTFCKDVAFGTLLQYLLEEKDLEINRRNQAGLTALHIACLVKASSHYCVEFLCDETQAYCEEIDLKAGDNEGRTPLHYAVSVNATAEATFLVTKGGVDLLLVKDMYGLRPCDYAPSDSPTVVAMQELGGIADSDSEPELNLEEIPVLQEYPLYLLALHSLLRLYLRRHPSVLQPDPPVLDHNEMLCYHFRLSASPSVCSLDQSTWKALPSYIEKFVEKIRELSPESEAIEQQLFWLRSKLT